MSTDAPFIAGERLLKRSDELRRGLTSDFRDQLVNALYADAQRLASSNIRSGQTSRWTFDARVDRVVTSRVWGLPIMLLLLTLVFWVTIVGANYPSDLIAAGLFWFEDQAAFATSSVGAPWWLTGFVWHGVFRGIAWVVSVMLPPMAIFFPVFTILEDLGYLPRVAFNLDWLFRRAGAHGKQALTMVMGFGCNAAGVIAARIIDSPRERLIAILTNNFVPCNGRWPTLIMLATLFIGSAVRPVYASLAAAGSLVAVVLLGIGVTLLASWGLTRSVLRGEASAFTLELPPYRRPGILRILYTSLIDRTVFVLLRALATAAPSGAVIWLLANITVDGSSLAQHAARLLNPVGVPIGLDGVIILAYIIAIPANEIVVPTMMMVYAGASTMSDIGSLEQIRSVLVHQHGWTMMNAVCLMLFSLLHNPCGTTILTIWKETKSLKWTLLGTFLPLACAFGITFAVATIWRMFA